MHFFKGMHPRFMVCDQKNKATNARMHFFKGMHPRFMVCDQNNKAMNARMIFLQVNISSTPLYLITNGHPYPLPGISDASHHPYQWLNWCQV